MDLYRNKHEKTTKKTQNLNSVDSQEIEPVEDFA